METNNQHTIPTPDTGKGSSIPWIAAAVFILGLAIMAGLYWQQHSAVKEVRFIGNTFTPNEQMLNVISSPIGLPADSIDFRSIIHTINALPYVKHTSVSVEARGVMNIMVTERRPLGLLIEGNKRAYVDSDGIILPVMPGSVKDVPLVYGFRVLAAGDTLKSKEFSQIRDFLAAARVSPFGWVSISEVAWNEREGVVALSHENGVKLVFGSDEFHRKIAYWETFYAEVVRQQGIRKFQTVDFRFRNQIVTRET